MNLTHSSLRLSLYVVLYADNEWLDAELQSILESALSSDPLDDARGSSSSSSSSLLLSLLPKSINWDVKRDLKDKMKTLDNKTLEAIRDIVST